MTSEPEEELDLSAGMVPHHNLGPVTGYDHEDGLPIVKRQAATIQTTEKSESSEGPAKKIASAGEKPEVTEPKPAKTAEPDASKPMAKQRLQPANLEKGQPVQLADGSRGKVAHLVQNMNSVRVRTEDGRNVMVARKTLKVPDSVFVRQHFRRVPG
jgi:hypothetical protein